MFAIQRYSKHVDGHQTLGSMTDRRSSTPVFFLRLARLVSIHFHFSGHVNILLTSPLL